MNNNIDRNKFVKIRKLLSQENKMILDSLEKDFFKYKVAFEIEILKKHIEKVDTIIDLESIDKKELRRFVWNQLYQKDYYY